MTRLHWLVLTVFSAILLTPLVARAQQHDVSGQLPVVLDSRSAALTSDTEGASESIHGAIELNPLAVFVAKFGGNVEILPGSHHALIGSLAGQDTGNYFQGVVAEAGYRYYTRPHTLAGPFLDASLMASWFSYRTNREGPAEYVSQDDTFGYGIAFDAGYQWIAFDRILIGAGGGLMVQHFKPRKYELYQSDFTSIAELFMDSGVRPRVLATMGVTF